MKLHPWPKIVFPTLAIFIVDALTPAGLAIWLAYILPLFIAARHFKEKQVYMFTAALSVLVILGGLFPPSGFFKPDVIFNRTAGILTGWVIATLLVRQRKAHESFLDLDEKLRALVEGSPVGNFLMQDERLVYVNNRLARLFGYSKDELLALNGVFELLHPDDALRAKNIFQDIGSGNASVSDFDIRGVRKDGMTVHTEFHVTNSMYGGRPTTMGSVADISERKEVEKRQWDFVAMVTHDLKSPLNLILGYSDIIIGKDDLDEDTRDMVKRIASSGNRVLDMVNYFLTVSKMEAGELKLKLTNEDPMEILKELEKSFSFIARRKGISLKVQFAPMEKVLMDRAYMERAITNLLQNAFNYVGPNGTVSLSAYSGERKLEGTRRNRGFLAISVSDTGPGIAPDELGRIFDKYYQCNNHGNGGAKGSGLGLAVVKAVAAAHGGRAAVESTPGKGSTFRIFLPIKETALAVAEDNL